jgi:hypothetical protein
MCSLQIECCILLPVPVPHPFPQTHAVTQTSPPPSWAACTPPPSSDTDIAPTLNTTEESVYIVQHKRKINRLLNKIMKKIFKRSTLHSNSTPAEHRNHFGPLAQHTLPKSRYPHMPRVIDSLPHTHRKT